MKANEVLAVAAMIRDVAQDVCNGLAEHDTDETARHHWTALAAAMRLTDAAMQTRELHRGIGMAPPRPPAAAPSMGAHPPVFEAPPPFAPPASIPVSIKPKKRRR